MPRNLLLDDNGLPDLFYATGMVYPEVESCRLRESDEAR